MFIAGWFKFGGVEFFKINFASALGEQSAWENRGSIYLAAAACAEFIADLFLCPLEAVRIRAVRCARAWWAHGRGRGKAGACV